MTLHLLTLTIAGPVGAARASADSVWFVVAATVGAVLSVVVGVSTIWQLRAARDAEGEAETATVRLKLGAETVELGDLSSPEARDRLAKLIEEAEQRSSDGGESAEGETGAAG
jgi:hypothetical protein